MAVTANITVSFGDQDGGGSGDAGGGHLSAEVDGRADGLNGGKTSFEPGDTAYFLVYHSNNVSVDDVSASAGTISTANVGSVTKEQDITFADTDSATLSIPASAISSTTWIGRSLGSLTLQPDGVTVKTSAKGVGVARVSYTTTNVEGYGLASPSSVAGSTDFQILVLVKGSVT